METKFKWILIESDGNGETYRAEVAEGYLIKCVQVQENVSVVFVPTNKRGKNQ